MAGIYKAYDVRGTYPDQLDETQAEQIGRAFVALTGTTDVMVGCDARTHSPSLMQAFIRGALAQGADVTVVGQITTSQMIAMRTWCNHATAVMVTASHLDAPYNGFKMLTGTGQYISENNRMRELEALATGKTPLPQPTRVGTQTTANYLATYVQHILALAGRTAGEHDETCIVVDASDGTIGAELEAYKAAVLPNLVILNAKPDGRFPSHSPNPIAPGATKQAGIAVRDHKAQFGVVFDADADRLVFLDEEGVMVHPNHLTCLLVTELLRENPGSAVAYDLISSRIVPETIRAAGGKPLRTKVGRANVIATMLAENAVFGAESSSHLMFRDACVGEAVGLCMLLIARAVQRAGKPLSALIAPFQGYALLPEQNYRVQNSAEALAAVTACFPGVPVDTLDGALFTFSNGWLNVRMSNTEPILRLRAEADTPEDLHALVERVEAALLSIGAQPAGGH